MHANPGRCPGAARGKRVRVRLANGYDTDVREPQGWTAEGGTNWSHDLGGFTIKEWELI